MAVKTYHIGIDLHGTLINNNEFLSEGSSDALIRVIKEKPSDIKLYLCTGNDLPFVKRKMGGIADLFDGAILETGCVVSTDMIKEEIIVTQNIVSLIKTLENTLLDCDYPEVYKFARRLATISMFTKYEYPLEGFFQKMKDDLQHLDYARVTRSSVAVDIIPIKHDKYRGLEYFGKSTDVYIAVADSLNDIEMLKKADISFMPANADPATVELLGKTKQKKPLGSQFDQKSLYISSKPVTFGVIEILENIYKNYTSF